MNSRYCVLQNPTSNLQMTRYRASSTLPRHLLILATNFEGLVTRLFLK